MSLLSKAKKSFAFLTSKIDTPLWLEIFFAVILILRIPTFFEPFYYGDEMIYLTLGQGIRSGVPLYLGLHDNKPPLLYIIAAIAGNVFWFKVLLAAFNLLSIYLFWKLISRLLPKKVWLHKVSVVIYGLLSTLPLLEGNIANAENFMIVPTLLAFLFAIKKENKIKNAFYAGVFFSLASLFKIVAAFDILGIIAFWFIISPKTKKGLLELVKKVAALSLGFIVPLGLTFVWYFLRGALHEYLVAAFLQNIGYVSSWRPEDVAKPFLEKNAPLLIRALIMFLGFGVLWLSQKKVSKPFILVSAWLLSSIFAVTLSERPYPHYILQALAPGSVLLGMLFTFQNIEQIAAILPLSLAFFVPFYYKFWYYPTTTYYQRFLNFASGKINKEEYFSGFSKYVPRNYKIAEFLADSSRPSDKIFVWSNDSPAIYSLSRRLPPTKYVADYHFIDFSNKNDVIETLTKNKPKYIILTNNSAEFQEIREFTRTNYYLISEIEGAEIWLKLENGL